MVKKPLRSPPSLLALSPRCILAGCPGGGGVCALKPLSLQARRRHTSHSPGHPAILSSILVLHAALRMRTAPVSGLLAPVALLLLLWPSERFTDACSCSPVHPQQAFCNADIVIRAKAIASKEVDSGNDVYGNPIKRIQYEVKQIKMFKGPTDDIQYIFTAPSSAVCGVPLETGGKKEYLIAGKAEGNGKMHITLCDFIVPWDSLTQTQKKSLNQRYEMGCECKISRCPSIPCYVSAHDECLWTDWMTEKSINGRQAKHYACIKRSDGSCSWYRGTAPPKQEFLDIEDP